MGPRADFVCESGKCDRGGRRTVYELPVKATRCAVCGSKKIKRLFNRVNIGRKDRLQPRLEPVAMNSSSLAKRVDAVVEGPVTAAIEKKEELARASRHPAVRAGRGKDMHAVMASAMGLVHPSLANLGHSVATGGETKRPAVIGGQLGGVLGGGMPEPRQATHIQLRDRDHRLVRNKQTGDISIEKA